MRNNCSCFSSFQTCRDEHSIYLEWDAPSVVHKSVDFYLVYFRGEDKWQFEEVRVDGNASRPAQTNVGFPNSFCKQEISKNKVPFPRKQILLTNLTTNSMHELKVRGATRSIYNESVVYRGDFSESQRILLKLNCDQVSQLL